MKNREFQHILDSQNAKGTCKLWGNRGKCVILPKLTSRESWHSQELLNRSGQVTKNLQNSTKGSRGGYWLLRSAVGMTHSLRSDLWWTIPFHVLLDHFGIPIISNPTGVDGLCFGYFVSGPLLYVPRNWPSKVDQVSGNVEEWTWNKIAKAQPIYTSVVGYDRCSVIGLKWSRDHLGGNQRPSGHLCVWLGLTWSWGIR